MRLSSTLFVTAKVSPGVGRRFPVSAPLPTPRRVSFSARDRDRHFGEIANMTKKASGHTAFILAIGLLVAGFAGPSRADDTTASDNVGMTVPINPSGAQAAPAGQTAGGDQLSDADRAARADDVKTPVVVTQAETPAPRTNPVVAGSQHATWDETSLIGKIFIGFGALLTIASAARMFIA